MLICTGVGIDYFNSSAAESRTLKLSLNYFQKNLTRARTVRYQRQLTKRTFTKVLLVTFRPPQTREGHADNYGQRGLKITQLISCLLHHFRQVECLAFPLSCFQVRNSVLSHWIIWSTEKLTPHCLRKETRNESTLQRSTAVMGKTRTRSYDGLQYRKSIVATNRSSWLILDPCPACFEKLVYSYFDRIRS